MQGNAIQCNRNHLYTSKLDILTRRSKFSDQILFFSYGLGENDEELRSSLKNGNSFPSSLKSFKDLKNSIKNNYMSFGLSIMYSMHEILRDVKNCRGQLPQCSLYEDDNHQISCLTCSKYIVLCFYIFYLFFIVVYIVF